MLEQPMGRRDAKIAEEKLLTTLQSRFNQQYLCDIFTVDVEDKESASLIKCMPSAY